MMIVGWSACVVGLVGGLALAITASLRSWSGGELILYGSTALFFLGFLAARLPNMVASAVKSRPDPSPLAISALATAHFDGLREGLAASLSVLSDGRAFLQIAGPWAAFLSLSAYVAVMLGAHEGHSATAAQYWLLGFLLLLLAALYLIIPSVAVAWFRWTLGGQLPRWFVALPDRTALGFAWRLWTVLTLLGGVDRLVTPKLTEVVNSALPPNMAAVGASTGWVVDILLVMLASSFALRLPAIAMNDAAFTRTMAIVQGRRMWPGLPMGLLLSLAPFSILAWSCGPLYRLIKPVGPKVHSAAATFDGLDGASLFVTLMLLFAILAAGASFLARAYLAAKTQVNGPSAPSYS